MKNSIFSFFCSFWSFLTPDGSRPQTDPKTTSHRHHTCPKIAPNWRQPDPKLTPNLTPNRTQTYSNWYQLNTGLLLVNLGKLGFFHKNWFFHYFKWNSGGLGVSRRTAPAVRCYLQSFSRFGGTWYQKVHLSTFSGKLTFQSTRNCTQNPPCCPGSLQDTFIIYSSISHQHIFQKYVAKRKISRIEHLKICKFKNQGSLTGAQQIDTNLISNWLSVISKIACRSGVFTLSVHCAQPLCKDCKVFAFKQSKDVQGFLQISLDIHGYPCHGYWLISMDVHESQ